MIKGSFTAPDGWVFAWSTQCEDCEKRAKCRHDCGHPGLILVSDAEGQAWLEISGIVPNKDVDRELAQFKRDHTGQMRLL